MRVYVLSMTYKLYLDWCAIWHINPAACECVTDPAALLGQLKPGDQVIDARLVPQRLVA
jgi:hypothetical protein